jgi:hypothetical protein
MLRPMVREHACSDSGRDKGPSQGETEGTRTQHDNSRVVPCPASPVVAFTVVAERTARWTSNKWKTRTIEIEDMDASSYVAPPKGRI